MRTYGQRNGSAAHRWRLRCIGPLISMRRGLQRCAAHGARPALNDGTIAAEASVILASLPSQDASCTVAAEIAQRQQQSKSISRPRLSDREPSTRSEAVLQPRGIALLDMPVTGGPSWAREGRLTGILAGSPAARDAAGPVLNCIAGRLIVVGDRAGQGQTAKVVNNMLSLSGD